MTGDLLAPPPPAEKATAPISLRCLSKSVLVEGQHACSSSVIGGSWDPTNLSGEELTTATRQGEEATGCQDQAWQSSTGDGTGDGCRGVVK
jgi:hypothetical protein